MTSLSAHDGSDEELHALNNQLAVMVRERERQARRLAQVAAQLQAALDDRERLFWHLRKLQEMLPICMDCGEIRAGETGQWVGVAEYLRQNDIQLTHGLCPPCEEARRADLAAPPRA